MTLERFVRRIRIAAPSADVFQWHALPGALERLTPPWESVRVLDRSGGIEDGARVTLGVRTGPFSLRWVSEHQDYIDGKQFRDVQVSGPFQRWEHTHRIEPDGPDACTLEDDIHYQLPFGIPGRLVGRPFVEQKLNRLFAYRHRTTQNDVEMHRSYRPPDPQRILVTGSSGLVGSALRSVLTTGGHRVTRLMRSVPQVELDAIEWNMMSGTSDPSLLEGFDAVVHLAGDNIADGRWNTAKKERIRNSRIVGTQYLCTVLAHLQRPPKVVVSASAVGYYGSREDSWLDEDSPPGSDFLAQVCQGWEAATALAASAHTRVVQLRFGVILSPAGGALAKMMLPFSLRAGGVIGDGRQYMSWIGLDDVVGVIYHSLMQNSLHGAVNVAAPLPLTNREFTQTLGHVLRRPTLAPLPAIAARAAFGELAEALLLSSARVNSQKLVISGYQFRHSELEQALRHLLG